ncbi:hypothetical protein L227DRAFT_30131 [Lentinus tigrinus ALCF2SS1-6]|uniref:Uncharacterized protein n=1 Tax=Lentinus tigrinus ALCF2SS1-6 TaxID=1328759 RepID=A0A5C2SEZ8_9APHY|nr:hypothetical protein L227DRAFT_30131 [Lentinus tigrinus ALCF2SS1-6]
MFGDRQAVVRLMTSPQAPSCIRGLVHTYLPLFAVCLPLSTLALYELDVFPHVLRKLTVADVLARGSSLASFVPSTSRQALTSPADVTWPYRVRTPPHAHACDASADQWRVHSARVVGTVHPTRQPPACVIELTPSERKGCPGVSRRSVCLVGIDENREGEAPQPVSQAHRLCRRPIHSVTERPRVLVPRRSYRVTDCSW